MLAALLVSWNDRPSQQIFSWHHFQDHLEVFQAIQKQKHINFSLQDIRDFPPADWLNWLLRHQAMHTQVNGVLGVGANDLQNVNMNDRVQRSAWVDLNFSEHQSWRQTLGI